MGTYMQAMIAHESHDGVVAEAWLCMHLREQGVYDGIQESRKRHAVFVAVDKMQHG